MFHFKKKKKLKGKREGLVEYYKFITIWATNVFSMYKYLGDSPPSNYLTQGILDFPPIICGMQTNQ